ncbi:MAG: TRAP-type mannitol/chloroaromatic compound transport system permease small subunit [Paracoccaceae bacterium]|jgi:TRAP-type mannitol/chloroaromatic compound transport system permease small subunit
MPSLNFILPHWLYWAGLVVFPLLAMALARRTRPAEKTYSVWLGWLILLTGGILGLHRFYMKNLWGLLFLPVFACILYANAQERTAREAYSNAANTVRVAERTIDREEPRLDSARAEIGDLRAEMAGIEVGSFAEKSAARRLKRAEDRIVTAEDRIATSKAELITATPIAEQRAAERAFWGQAARYAFYTLLAAIVLDAVLMPMLVAAAKVRLAANPPPVHVVAMGDDQVDMGAGADADAAKVTKGWTGWIDRLSLYAGEFVSYWAVIAVFVYYYEVIARYVFNSPTNWAHESMYLMFGMQYLISGSYAMLSESHVRVDVFYATFSDRKKAIVDLSTSVFFFIFAGTLFYTGWIFAMDSIAVPTGNAGLSEWARGQAGFGEALGRLGSDIADSSIRFGEISFNEWEVALWPMKFMMVAGGALLLLQGVSKVAQDVRVLGRGA